MKKVIVTSPATDAGKTFIAAGLVEAAASRGLRTLFLELDTVGDAIRVFGLKHRERGSYPDVLTWANFPNWGSDCLQTPAGAGYLPRPDSDAGPLASESIANLLSAAEKLYDLVVADLGSDCYTRYWTPMVLCADAAMLVADCDQKALKRVKSFLSSYCPAEPVHKWILAVNSRDRKGDFKPKDLIRFFAGSGQIGEALVIPHIEVEKNAVATFPPDSAIAQKIILNVYGKTRGARKRKVKKDGFPNSPSWFTRLFGRKNFERADDRSGSDVRPGQACVPSSQTADTRNARLSVGGAGTTGHVGIVPPPANWNNRQGLLLLVGERALGLTEALAGKGWKTTSDRSTPAEMAVIDIDQVSATSGLGFPRIALGSGRISEYYQADDDVMVVSGPSLVFDLLDSYRKRNAAAASKTAAMSLAGSAFPTLSNGSGTVIAFYSGAQGYQGKTMLAVNSGALLASRGKGVCVVDMDSDKAGLTLLLGFSEMRPPATDLASDMQNLTTDVVPGPAGVSVIPAPIATRQPGWFPSTEQVVWLISTLSHKYEYVILDFGAKLASPPVIEALRLSDRIFIVSTPMRTALTAISRFRGSEISGIGNGKTEAIINRVTRESLTASDAARLLGFASYHEIPDDPVVVEAENDAVGNRIYHPPVLRKTNVIEPPLSMILESMKKEAKMFA